MVLQPYRSQAYVCPWQSVKYTFLSLTAICSLIGGKKKKKRSGCQVTINKNGTLGYGRDLLPFWARDVAQQG